MISMRENYNGKKKQDRLEDCMYRLDMPDCPRSLCVIGGEKRYFVIDSPYCYRRCDRYYNSTGQIYKKLKGGNDNGRK